jgi:para-nitrobenzyl esterase
MRPEGLELGASHAFEIPFLLGTEENFRERGATDDQVELSRQMIRYCTRFARNGDPNGGGDTNWPAFASASQVLQLNRPEPAPIEGEDFAT